MQLPNNSGKPKMVLQKDGKTVFLTDKKIVLPLTTIAEMIQTKKIWSQDYEWDDSLKKFHDRQVKFLANYEYAKAYMKKHGRPPPFNEKIPDKYAGKIMQSQQAVKDGLID